MKGIPGRVTKALPSQAKLNALIIQAQRSSS